LWAAEQGSGIQTREEDAIFEVFFLVFCSWGRGALHACCLLLVLVLVLVLACPYDFCVGPVAYPKLRSSFSEPAVRTTKGNITYHSTPFPHPSKIRLSA
jgi:hypothetical protein